MVHWTGKGYLGLVVPIAVFGLAQVGHFLSNKVWSPLPELTVWLCLVVSAVILWVVGYRLNRIEDKSLGPATTTPTPWYQRNINHSLLFVPLEFFGLVMIAIYVFQKIVNS